MYRLLFQKDGKTWLGSDWEYTDNKYFIIEQARRETLKHLDVPVWAEFRLAEEEEKNTYFKELYEEQQRKAIEAAKRKIDRKITISASGQEPDADSGGHTVDVQGF